MKNSYKNWIIKTLLMTCVILIPVAIFNYIFDPLWCFEISHKFNRIQDDFDERQQKTNYITFHKQKYQGIILGNSRVTIISPRSFSGIKVFNYSSNGMPIWEYPYVLDYAIKMNGEEFKYVFIGMDFLDTCRVSNKTYNHFRKSLRNTNSFLYRFKILLNLDTLKFSQKILRNYFKGKNPYYDRHFIKHCVKIPSEVHNKIIDYQLKEHIVTKTPCFLNTYTYKDIYIKTLKDIKNTNPNGEFIIFTLPMITSFYSYIVKYDLLDDYFRWLEEIVEVYGQCYHFMYPTSISDDNQRYFYDYYHFYPEVGDMIADVIFNKKEKETDFGFLITKKNFSEKKRYLKKIITQRKY